MLIPLPHFTWKTGVSVLAKVSLGDQGRLPTDVMQQVIIVIGVIGVIGTICGHGHMCGRYSDSAPACEPRLFRLAQFMGLFLLEPFHVVWHLCNRRCPCTSSRFCPFEIDYERARHWESQGNGGGSRFVEDWAMYCSTSTEVREHNILRMLVQYTEHCYRKHPLYITFFLLVDTQISHRDRHSQRLHPITCSANMTTHVKCIVWLVTWV
jgi:hypothetical protein